MALSPPGDRLAFFAGLTIFFAPILFCLHPFPFLSNRGKSFCDSDFLARPRNHREENHLYLSSCCLCPSPSGCNLIGSHRQWMQWRRPMLRFDINIFFFDFPGNFPLPRAGVASSKLGHRRRASSTKRWVDIHHFRTTKTNHFFVQGLILVTRNG